MRIAKLRLYGSKRVDWCSDEIQQYAATPTSDWSDSYNQYIEIVLENKEKIKIDAGQLLKDYYYARIPSKDKKQEEGSKGNSNQDNG
tara:strand:- start:1152 stop:1412 length:261 start_codon:yes stop_codon:yes gene_type:complete